MMLLTADEAAGLHVGVNVLIRTVAPQVDAALVGPCSTCDGLRWLPIMHHIGESILDHHPTPCPDCRDGRQLVPLWTECERCRGVGHVREGTLNELRQEPHAATICTCPENDCIDGRVLLGRGRSIEVVPVVKGKVTGLPCLDYHGRLDVLPFRLSEAVPGRDWGIVIDCADLA